MNSNQHTDKPDAFTLGPLEEGPACCDPQPVVQVRNLSLLYDGKTALEVAEARGHESVVGVLRESA